MAYNATGNSSLTSFPIVNLHHFFRHPPITRRRVPLPKLVPSCALVLAVVVEDVTINALIYGLIGRVFIR